MANPIIITNITNIFHTNYFSNFITDIKDIKWGAQDWSNVVLGILGLAGTVAIIIFARQANRLQKYLSEFQQEWYNNETRGALAIQDIKLRNIFSLIDSNRSFATAEIVLTIENLFGGLVYDIFVDYQISHKEIEIANSTKRWIFISGKKTKDFIIRFPLSTKINEIEEINRIIKREIRNNLEIGIQQHSWETSPLIRSIGQYNFVISLANNVNGIVVPQEAIRIDYDLSENEWIWNRPDKEPSTLEVSIFSKPSTPKPNN